jgi:hypothetical protein
MSDGCPHCGHGWSYHAPRCTTCGCQWSEPKPPKPPPSARDELVANIENTMFDELDRQHEADEIGGCGYWNREKWQTLDGEPNWTKVAEAVAALFVDSEDDCSSCHSPSAIYVWKQPITEVDAG